MSIYLPVSTSADAPIAVSRDSVSVNSESHLLNHESPIHTSYPFQQYELRPIPTKRTGNHVISRKPLPTSSTPQYSATLDQASSSHATSAPIENIQAISHETSGTLPDEIGGSHGAHENYAGHRMDSESFLQAEHQDDISSEHDLHLSSNTQSNHPGITPNTRGARPKPSFVHRLWLWEIAASALSLACMASIIGVLSYEQGRRLDQWGLGKGFFTPTVVVSFLGTLAKSACLLVLTEVISQLKWLHFQNKPQKLSDLQLFDDASRGPWGAFQLASIRNRKTILASVASILVVTSLLVDPFIQSVFRQPVILTPVKGVSPGILETRVYDPSSLHARFGQCYGAASVPSKMQAAILAPIWNDSSSIATMQFRAMQLADMVPTCVVNTEPAKSFEMIVCNYTVPSQGATLNAVFGITGGASVRTPYSTLWNSIAGDQWQNTLSNAWNHQSRPSFTESRPAVLSNFTFVKFPPDIISYDYVDAKNNRLRKVPPVSQAMHCTLKLCARTFTQPYCANFSAAPLAGPRMALMTTTDGTTEGNDDNVFIGLKPASTDRLSEETKFRINYCNYKDIARYLKDLFTTAMSTTGVVGTTNDSSTTGFSEQIRQRVTPGLGLAFSQFDDIAELMDGVADSMTEAFRTSANNTVLDGVAMSSVTYIEITWPPLILPIALVIMTFAMLIVMIIRNNQRGMPIWKSSSLALLFHELQGWDSPKNEVNGPKEVQERAKSVHTGVTNGEGKLYFSKAE